MRAKSFKKKLVLSKQTISNLSNTELVKVVGGIKVPEDPKPTTYTFPVNQCPTYSCGPIHCGGVQKEQTVKQ